MPDLPEVHLVVNVGVEMNPPLVCRTEGQGEADVEMEVNDSRPYVQTTLLAHTCMLSESVRVRVWASTARVVGYYKGWTSEVKALEEQTLHQKGLWDVNDLELDA